MLIASEIVEIIQECIEDRKEQVLVINELSEAIRYNPDRLCDDLDEQAEDIADGDFCPRCTSDLKYNTYSERSEYFGQPCDEYVTVGECENSGCDYSTEE